MSYLATYLKTIAERGNIDLAHSIEHTATEIGDKYIQDFNFCEHRIGLLFGNVQSGKPDRCLESSRKQQIWGSLPLCC